MGLFAMAFIINIKQMRILIVEDEVEIANFLKAGFEQEGFAVDVAHDGKRGLFLATTNDYDLMILDMILPGMNGDQVCKSIRDDGKIFPIIILTVKSEIDTKVNLFGLGADDYMTKPFSFKELRARCSAVLKRNNSITQEIIRLADLEMDQKKRIVKRGGDSIYLTRKEFSLLEYLLVHAGEAVSRNVIIEHIWDVNANPFSNTIETHVKNLRNKIDKGHNLKLLRTIPGVGYKLGLDD